MHLITADTRAPKKRPRAPACIHAAKRLCIRVYKYDVTRFGIGKGEHPGGALSTDNSAVRSWMENGVKFELKTQFSDSVSSIFHDGIGKIVCGNRWSEETRSAEHPFRLENSALRKMFPGEKFCSSVHSN